MKTLATLASDSMVKLLQISYLRLPSIEEMSDLDQRDLSTNTTSITDILNSLDKSPTYIPPLLIC